MMGKMEGNTGLNLEKNMKRKKCNKRCTDLLPYSLLTTCFPPGRQGEGGPSRRPVVWTGLSVDSRRGIFNTIGCFAGSHFSFIPY